MILDKTLAIEKAGGDPTLAKDLFTMLIKELPTLREGLNDALAKQAMKPLWDVAHKIHGSTAYCGVPELKQAAKQLEDAIKSRVTDINKLATNVTQVNDAIDQLLNQGSQYIADW